MYSNSNKNYKEITDSLLIWGNNNYREFSWRNNPTPYRILVAELLLRRTTATAVERIYDEFLSKYHDLLSLSKANQNDIELLLKSIGYNKLRAKIIIEVATNIIDKYGEIPCDIEKLTKIRHIGNYTAGAILSLGYEKRATMVDSNVKRIIKRVFSSLLTKNNSDNTFVKIAENLLPPNFYIQFNLALLDFGAKICRSTNPLHEICPIKDSCDYYQSICFRGTA